MKKIVTVRKKALAANDEYAAMVRARCVAERTLVANLISSPGSGKTSLLEATARRVGDDARNRFSMAVIEGDVATENDAERIRAAGVSAHQILTAGACHLDARQIAAAVEREGLLPTDILFIENVGNLICPTTYDLGEDFKVVVLSTTEGDDKPLKYPAIFSRAEVAVISKIDLLPHVPFDLETVRSRIATLNPDCEIVVVSALTGDGLDDWYSLLARRLADKRDR